MTTKQQFIAQTISAYKAKATQEGVQETSEDQWAQIARQQTETFLAAKMAERTQQGLKLVVCHPDSTEPFTCYPKDTAQKTNWLARYRREGWTICVS